jgi:hypothetical protein
MDANKHRYYYNLCLFVIIRGSLILFPLFYFQLKWNKIKRILTKFKTFMQPFFSLIIRGKNDFITKRENMKTRKKIKISFITDSVCLVAPWSAKHIPPE